MPCRLVCRYERLEERSVLAEDGGIRYTYLGGGGGKDLPHTLSPPPGDLKG